MLIRIDDILALLEVSRTQLYHIMNLPDFPKPVVQHGKVFWEYEEVKSWVVSGNE